MVESWVGRQCHSVPEKEACAPPHHSLKVSATGGMLGGLAPPSLIIYYFLFPHLEQE